MRSIYKTGFWISAMITIVSLMILVIYGLPLGVDFKGGSVMEVEFSGNQPTASEIKTIIQDFGFLNNITVQLSGESNAILRFSEIGEQDHQQVLSKIVESFGEVQEQRFDSVGPVIGKDLKTKSVRALILVFFAIIIYIALAFRKMASVLSPWAMGVAAIVALLHDVLITGAVFSILGRFYGIEITAVFVAAALTILGYSVSDSVVVFDRIRENILRKGRSDFGEKVHVSVIQTLSRSINTSLTTILPLVAIYFFGGETIQAFSLALIIGIILGTYSSIFVASPILIWLSKNR